MLFPGVVCRGCSCVNGLGEPGGQTINVGLPNSCGGDENLRIASKLGKKAKNLLTGQKKFGLHSAKELKLGERLPHSRTSKLKVEKTKEVASFRLPCRPPAPKKEEMGKGSAFRVSSAKHRKVGLTSARSAVALPYSPTAPQTGKGCAGSESFPPGRAI